MQSDGSLACWGDNDYTQSTPPSGTFTQVSAGNEFTCGLKSNGTLACWGRNNHGQATPPLGTFTQVSAGEVHACGLKSDGTLACWGDNGYGKSTSPAGSFTQVSAGGEHTCGLQSDGTLACWGLDNYGQSTPPLGTFTQVSAGELHTCGLKSDGTIVCWGAGTTNTGVDPDYGQSMPPAGTFTQVSAGLYHSCGLKSDGSLTCWGGNDYGQSNPFSISGSLGVAGAGATLSYTDGSVKTATAGGSGDYSLFVSYDWSGTVTPSKTGYTFSPVNLTYTNVLVNQTAQNYIASLKTYLLSVSNTGTGSGTVTSSPGGITCGATCSASFNYNTAVTLTATAATGSTFTGWSGSGCSGTGTCMVIMTAARSVTANYTLNTYTITGNAGDAGVVLHYTNVTAKTVTSASNGRYTITVHYGWSGPVTPTKTGVTFNPANRTYPSLTNNQTAQDYTDTRTLTSTAAYDGWILESAKGSGVGGSMNSSATTFQIGDSALNRQYRAILSFDTRPLPDTAIIQSAVLKIYQSGSTVGSISSLGSLYVSIRKGYFSTSYFLQLADFNAPNTASKVAAFGTTPVSGWYSATLISSGRSNINTTGLTQFRLFFNTATNANSVADYRKFVSGDGTNKPQLIITYTLP